MSRIHKTTPLWRVLALAMAIAEGGVSTAHAQAVNLDSGKLAVSGYDVVSYFTDGQALKGSTTYTATYQGGTYQFATAAHRDAFTAEPARFIPAYGGYCAYGVSQGHKVNIDPEAFKVVDGRLYLNYSKSVQKKWFADIPGFIATAEKNWVALRDKPHD